ncbi:Proteasome component [Gracilaria domingensis]|nr:Proteasome component [Gracilaria domingensis]
MTTPAATEYIEQRVASAPDESTKAALTTLKDLYSQKLWHQLTEYVKTIVADPKISDKIGLYTSFLKHFEAKLNPVSLVQILVDVVRAELHQNPVDAVAFLSPLLVADGEKSTVVTSSDEAHVLLLSHVAVLHMHANDNAACKKDVEGARVLVEAAHDMSPLVHSAFYRAAAEYHKVVGTASDFFRNALQFLAYTPPEALTVPVQHRWAFDIGIAALVGNDIYNFGEVLSHSIVHSLRGSENEWLLLLLEAFNSGDLEKFDSVCQQSSAQMNAQPVLVANEEFLKQKVTILALMELCFSRSLENSIPFADVQKTCRLPLKEVEYLLMRSMSLGLISGEIDNVDQCVTISRVQPRVLGRESIGEMAKRLSKWSQHVTDTVAFLNKTTVGIVE